MMWIFTCWKGFLEIEAADLAMQSFCEPLQAVGWFNIKISYMTVIAQIRCYYKQLSFIMRIPRLIRLHLWINSSPLALHICVSESGQHWFRQWLVGNSAPSHCLNQCWVFVNWTLRNTLQWNFNQNIKIFIHENASENIFCTMAAILFRGRWVKG